MPSLELGQGGGERPLDAPGKWFVTGDFSPPSRCFDVQGGCM